MTYHILGRIFDADDILDKLRGVQNVDDRLGHLDRMQVVSFYSGETDFFRRIVFLAIKITASCL
jgi:hypothetical protein